MCARFVRVELLLVALSLGCNQANDSPPPRAAASARSSNQLTYLLAPRSAGRFQMVDGKLRQEQPRLPDAGEWRCAERGSIVWCAGGEAPAGVVTGPPDRAYRCGPRWGGPDDGERVCMDHHPDYPAPSGVAPYGGKWQQCRFEQERGGARVCERGAASEGPALPARAVPACWLDRDCPSGHCDRGACACGSREDCKLGSCIGGFCVEVTP